ncbi:MAG: TolC family outer membrane protein [Proteobacteria bacterium]|nr:TolC family outer membrane protein [Pseudomonadota bacterium]
MIRRPLALALAFVLLPATASAADLLRTYEMARAGDPQLSAAEANRLAIREGAVQARAALLPQLGGSASLTRSRSDSEGTQAFGSTLIPNNGTNETTTRQAGLRLEQMIYDRANFTRLKSQRALSQAGDFQLESASDSLVTRTSAAYFNVLVAIETLAAAQAAETALQKQFDFASKRLEVGLAPITDVHEARATFDSARAQTILAENALEDAYQALAEITGQPVRNLRALPEDFQPALPESEGADSWVQTAFDNNPALRAKEFQVRATAANVQTARAGHWPTLYFGGSYGDTNTEGSSSNNIANEVTDFQNDSQARSIGITLSVPIFSGGAVQSGVRQAIAQRDIASDELEQQKRALERNTRNAYQALVAGISEIEARRLALFSARSAYDASQVGLEVGTRTVLDVLINQQNLFTAQQAYALARYNYLQNRLLLEQAAGTLDIQDVQEINRLLTADAEAQLDPGSN